jgi:iron-sulfur cluster repair protein YtfE (RIC family)
MPADHQAEDLAVAEEIEAHHALMIRDLDRLATAVEDAARSEGDVDAARSELQAWVAAVLEPHAEEEEHLTYRAAGQLTQGAPMIASMLSEHELIRASARRIPDAADPHAAAAYARMLYEIFHSHQRKEDEIIVPMLLAADGVSLSELVGDATAHGAEGSHHHAHHEHPRHDH